MSFGGAQFGDGGVNFTGGAQFGDGAVDFRFAQFGDGTVDFGFAQFGEGEVSFGRAQFGDGAVSFNSARAPGDFTLSHARLGKGAYDFERGDFERRAFFDGLQGTEHVTSFSFRYASFEKPLVLSTHANEPFGCVVDLTDTQINSHVSLQGLTLQPKETTQKDIGRFCRLKELAEGQKDLESALEFKAQEIKTVSNLSPNPLVWLLTFSFWLLSNFGRSVSLPCLSLGSVWLGFALWYAELAPRIKFGIEPLIPSWNAFKDSGALTFSASQMLGLLPSSRKADKTAQEQLFGDCTGCLPEGLYAITAFQSILSLMLLFLLGLALRNRFRL